MSFPDSAQNPLRASSSDDDREALSSAEAAEPDGAAASLSSIAFAAAETPLAPGLYVVGTPIGNLEDISLRALRVLRTVDRIACEDTRHTQKLLNHYGIAKPTVSYHLHNEGPRAAELLEGLRAGARIAVVSDAGMPGIADPGALLVREAIAAGCAVFPVPGANAALSALVAAGFEAERFTFHGFLPAKGGQRRSVLEALRASMASASEDVTQVFYEAPHRILEALEDVNAIFGPAYRVVLARELTKMHEEFQRGTAAEVLATLRSRPAVRGEMVLLLDGQLPGSGEEAVTTASLAEDVAARVRSGESEKEALKHAAKARGLGKSEAYREWQRHKR